MPQVLIRTAQKRPCRPVDALADVVAEPVAARIDTKLWS